MDRNKAWELLCEYTKNENLRKHMLAVEVCMRAYAKKFGRLEAETMSASIKVSSEKALMELDNELKYPRYEEGVMDVIESMGLEVRRRGGLRAA